MGTDGFEFIEYAAPDPAAMGRAFEAMGFKPVARHRHKNVLLYRQGTINFLINAEPDSFAQRFARLHGPSVRDCLPGCTTPRPPTSAPCRSAHGATPAGGPGRAEHPRHQGHWRQPDLLRRPLARQGRAQPGDIGNIGFFDVDFEALPGISAQEAPCTRLAMA